MKYITEYWDVKLVVLNCDIKVKFEKMFNVLFKRFSKEVSKT